MKQVLCLSNLLEDELLAPLCVGNTRRAILEEELRDSRSKGKSLAVTVESDDEIVSPSPLASEDVPQKNTFIHYDIPRSPTARPPTPTSSAPSILLRRLFKTKAGESDATCDFPLSSLSSESISSTLGDDAVAKKDDFEGNCDQDSEASTSAAGSPADMGSCRGSTSSAGFAINANAVTLEMHKLGQCTPCNYFWYKIDGCRQGSECSFCHFCPKGEIKKRKKDKMKQLRKAGIVESKRR